MEIKFDIYRRNRTTKSVFIDNYIILTDDEIEQAALDKFLHDYDIDKDCEYSARINKTII